MTLETQDMKSQLLHVLEKGESNAIPGPQLRSILGVRDLRPYRALMVEMTIEDRVAIIGDADCGYYIAGCRSEVHASRQKLLSYIRNLAIRARALREIEESMPPQMEMGL